ncbi:cytochrome P450 [Yinghuangia sp. YIM S10712]|uniref:cytochrome P450 n=1 Tax=Yinghuangia sp. YIM S10712 TaxID=3436930 RepID=UPI003F53B716
MTYETDQSPIVPRLFGTAFSERPAAAYDELRAVGPVAWGQIAEGVYVLVVTNHAAARELLTDPEYTRDPGAWEALAHGGVPASLALMYAGGLQHTDGPDHERLRRAVDDCLAAVDLHAVRRTVQRHARTLIDAFAHRGHADLMAEYADPVSLRTLTDLLGCPPDAADRIRAHIRSVIAAEQDAAEASAELAHVLREVIAAKKYRPGADVTSWMLAHPALLSDREVQCQLASVILLGAAPTAAWIGATLHTLLTERAYASELVGGAVTIRQAMNETLSSRSPVANASVHYARFPKVLHGVHIPVGVPVLVSHAATGLDPDRPGRNASRDRSHLAWSAGAHRCPAQILAATIAETAIETVVDAVWDLTTPTPAIAGRPGPFQQCPVHVGVLFPPVPPVPPHAPGRPPENHRFSPMADAAKR